MQIIQGDLTKIAPLSKPVALTLGNFDGIHLGHRYLIEKMMEKSQSLNVESVVLSFDPHPAKVLEEGLFKPLIDREEKVGELEKLGVDYFVIQDFSMAFAELSAEDFLRQCLQRYFDLTALVLGFDFRFGKAGAGDINLAEFYFADFKTKVFQEKPFFLNQTRVSSSAIKQAIIDGKIGDANALLGRPFQVRGLVVRGKAIGKTIGFPTANVSGISTIIPKNGVYITKALCNGHWFKSLVNIGSRPTVGGGAISVEAHLLDFEGNLYNQELVIEFIDRIRDEKKFETIDRLKDQIQEDVKVARHYFDS